MIETCQGTLIFQFPRPPESLLQWAQKEARQWQGLDDFDLLVQLEERSGLQVEIARGALSPRLWGFTYAQRKLGRCRIYLNSQLPPFWQRFALFHEIYHLLHHSRECYFWSSTNVAMTSFEHQADLFAWAAVLAEEQEF